MRAASSPVTVSTSSVPLPSVCVIIKTPPLSPRLASAGCKPVAMARKHVGEVAAGPDAEAGDHLPNCLDTERMVDAKSVFQLCLTIKVFNLFLWSSSCCWSLMCFVLYSLKGKRKWFSRCGLFTLVFQQFVRNKQTSVIRSDTVSLFCEWICRWCKCIHVKLCQHLFIYVFILCAFLKLYIWISI